MTIEQRKISLIEWITQVEDEDMLRNIEQIKNTFPIDIPPEIMTLLDISSAVNDTDLIEHSSTRELLDE
tara:strand:+ start:5805 stop:6011 length:207 start_codon:yes stop_codon:yes gene_type:complete